MSRPRARPAALIAALCGAGLHGCTPTPEIEASLPACARWPSVDTTGWVEVRQPELRFLVPPGYGPPERLLAEYEVLVRLGAPSQFINVQYGSTANRLEQFSKVSARRRVNESIRPSCAAVLGGRRARVAVWEKSVDSWNAPLPERPNYGVGAYWPPVRGDSGLTLTVITRDSTLIDQSLAIARSVELLGARGP